MKTYRVKTSSGVMKETAWFRADFEYLSLGVVANNVRQLRETVADVFSLCCRAPTVPPGVAANPKPAWTYGSTTSRRRDTVTDFICSSCGGSTGPSSYLRFSVIDGDKIVFIRNSTVSAELLHFIDPLEAEIFEYALDAFLSELGTRIGSILMSDSRNSVVTDVEKVFETLAEAFQGREF